MRFSELNSKHYELTVFCNLKFTNIIGGVSKLFKHFIKSLKPESIISYCDNRIFTCKMKIWDCLLLTI
jgi:hypothetical protein